MLLSWINIFTGSLNSDMKSEQQDREQALVLHQSPLNCGFELKARSTEEGPRHVRYLCIFFIINDVVLSSISGGPSNTITDNFDYFHSSQLKYDDDEDDSLLIMSSIDVLWEEWRPKKPNPKFVGSPWTPEGRGKRPRTSSSQILKRLFRNTYQPVLALNPFEHLLDDEAAHSGDGTTIMRVLLFRKCLRIFTIL